MALNMRLLIFLTSFLMIQIVRHAVGTPSFEKEPSCSPFHFEEKLLEKTVRLEHSVGLMMDEIKSFVAITETKMVESETKMAASEAKMAALQLQNEDLKLQVEYLQGVLNETLKEVVEHPRSKGFQVAFTADTPAAGPESKTLTFTNVLTNIGSQYDVTSGKFTSKHAGLYYFSFSLFKARVNDRAQADRVECHLVLNGQNKVFAGTDPMDDDTDRGRYEASNSMVLHLDSSDVVNLGGCYATMSAYGKSSSFSGFLIELD